MCGLKSSERFSIYLSRKVFEFHTVVSCVEFDVQIPEPSIQQLSFSLRATSGVLERPQDAHISFTALSSQYGSGTFDAAWYAQGSHEPSIVKPLLFEITIIPDAESESFDRQFKAMRTCKRLRLEAKDIPLQHTCAPFGA